MEWFTLKQTYRIAILACVFAIPCNLNSQTCDDWNNDLNELLAKELSNEPFLKNLLEIANAYKNIDCPNSASNIWRFIGFTHMELNEYDNAEEALRTSYDHALLSNDPHVLGSSLNMMGYIYSVQEQYDSCVYYYQNALGSFKEVSDTINLMAVYANLSSTYYQLDNLSMAYYYHDKLHEMAQMARNEKYLSSAVEIKLLIDSDSTGVDNNTFLALRNNFRFFKNSKNLEGQYTSIENMGYCHELLHIYDSAIHYYSTASLYADSLNSLVRFRWMNNKVTDLSLIVNEQSKNRQLWIYALVSVLGVLSIASFIYLKYRQQRELIKDQQIDELLSGNERGFLQAQIEGQEEERKRLAEELHDRLGGMMATLKMRYSAIEENILGMDDVTKIKYSQASELLNETTQEIRRISHDLHSGVLTEYGLRTALEQLGDALKEQKETQFHWYFNNMDERLNGEVELNVFRIVQESISNILKHAKAKEVTVQLSRNNGELNVMIEDDGKGFDVNKLKKKHGIGLQNIESRVTRINGKFILDSKPDRGTITIFDIPVRT